MGDMRSVDVAHPLAAEVYDLAVGQFARRAITQVVERDHTTGRTMCDLRVWCSGQKFVHRPTFVGLDMPETDPSQPLQRHDSSDCLRHQRKHAPPASMEQHRFVGIDKELVEGEASGRGIGHAGGETVDAICYFVGRRLHADSPRIRAVGARTEGRTLARRIALNYTNGLIYYLN
jgi:hypothetical protein